MHFVASNDSLTIRAKSVHGAVEYRLPGEYRPQIFSIPFSALSQLHAKRRQPITFEVQDASELLVSWTEDNVPQHVRLPAGIPEPSGFPPIPRELSENPATLAEALCAAGETTDDSSGRYALGCLQLRGGEQGRITGTDGHQILLQSGFAFPWTGDLLIPGVAGLPIDQLSAPVRVGRSEDWVTICVGSWTMHLRIQNDKRFPCVDGLVPAASLANARLLIHPQDAAFLAKALPRLPCPATDRHKSVTIDLGDQVTVRSCDAGPPTELILSNSTARGDGRIAINRTFFGRALRLGFSEFQIFDTLVACHDRNRTFAWMTLASSCAISPTDASIRVETPKATLGRVGRRTTLAA